MTDDKKHDYDIPGLEEVEKGEDTRIRQRAYEIWLEEGQPQGRAVEHWLQAKREFEERGEDVKLAEAEITSLGESD
jgi:hypothetical protein